MSLYEDKKLKIETRYDEIFKVNITTTIPGDGSISLAFKYDESSGGNEITYKYKDPRDALHFIVNYWKEISPIESISHMNYIQGGCGLGLYTQMDIYYLTILEILLDVNLVFSICNPLPSVLNDANMSAATKLKYFKILDEFQETLNRETRIAHRFAVANTWKFWNAQKPNEGISSEIPVTEAGLLKLAVKEKDLFDKEYKGREIDYAHGFNRFWRLWKVIFKDGSWVIASDQGNGWYAAKTDFNSYKLIGND